VGPGDTAPVRLAECCSIYGAHSAYPITLYALPEPGSDFSTICCPLPNAYKDTNHLANLTDCVADPVANRHANEHSDSLADHHANERSDHESYYRN